MNTSTSTDFSIVTDDYVVIVDCWQNYMSSFNKLHKCDHTKSLVVAFFGTDSSKLDIINYFNHHHIDVWEFIESQDDINVYIHPYNNNFHDDDKTDLPMLIKANLALYKSKN